MSSRSFVSCLLAFAASVCTSAAFAQAVTVVEYYNSKLDAYFITGRLNEQLTLDAVGDFRRTGVSFQAVAAETSDASKTRICRFYISAMNPPTSTHFYGREGVDCESILAQNPPGFAYEGFDFAIAQPVGGACAPGTMPVYRGFRAGTSTKTANHRYTVSMSSYLAAQQDGYVGEQAAFCATAVTDRLATVESTAKCGTFYVAGQRISYQSINSEGTPASFTRFLSDSATTFNGHSDALPVVERAASGSPLSTMILDGASSWTVLGTSTIDADGLNDVYYSNPTTYPRDFAPGQSVSVDRQLTYSRANSFGTVTQTGGLTYVGKEAVAVDAGSYTSACKYASQITTSYAATRETVITRTTTWVADGVGIVKTLSDMQVSVDNGTPAHVATETAAVFVQPL